MSNIDTWKDFFSFEYELNSRGTDISNGMLEWNIRILIWKIMKKKFKYRKITTNWNKLWTSGMKCSKCKYDRELNIEI